jgi:hypothetical protein
MTITQGRTIHARNRDWSIGPRYPIDRRLTDDSAISMVRERSRPGSIIAIQRVVSGTSCTSSITGGGIKFAKTINHHENINSEG